MVYYYDNEAADWWHLKGVLPGNRHHLRGSVLSGVFYITGGADVILDGSSCSSTCNYQASGHVYSSILAWDNERYTWSLVGYMEGAMSFHTVTEISLASLLCTTDSSSSAMAASTIANLVDTTVADIPNTITGMSPNICNM